MFWFFTFPFLGLFSLEVHSLRQQDFKYYLLKMKNSMLDILNKIGSMFASNCTKSNGMCLYSNVCRYFTT